MLIFALLLLPSALNGRHLHFKRFRRIDMDISLREEAGNPAFPGDSLIAYFAHRVHDCPFRK